MRKIKLAPFVVTSFVFLFTIVSGLKSQTEDMAMANQVFYRTAKVDGLTIFYREAGRKNAPPILLLHGLPWSSRMFDPLLARLADQYHLIAPDYPGFGHSDWPDPKLFAYTFDHIAQIIDDFSQVLGLSRYTLYMQDYGGPVGFHMVLAHPGRVEALIVQDAVAHNEGLGANWSTRRAFWRIVQRMKKICERICFQWLPPKHATSGTIRVWNSIIPISGPTSTRF